MPEAHVVIRNKVGLHARPASLFVAEAKKHPCKIMIQTASRQVDAKSILSVLSLGVHCGQSVTISAEGNGAEEALKCLVELANALPEVL